MTDFKFVKPQDGFLALPEKEAFSYDSAKAVIVPFGLEDSVTYGGGTRRGPKAIIAASPELEYFDEDLWCEPFRKYGLITMKELEIAKEMKAALSQLEEVTEKLLADNKFPLILGGEHSITAGSIRPFAKRYKDLKILHFDAHADLRDGYLGEHYSHASALRRCLDFEHIELVSIGIRNISKSEIPFYEANKERVHIHFAKDRNNWDIDKILAPLKGKPVYLTFDVDGFDASLMQATGTPEPGGLFWDETMKFIKEAAKISNIVGADVNELAPIPNFHGYDFLAAKLVYKILNYSLYRS